MPDTLKEREGMGKRVSYARFKLNDVRPIQLDKLAIFESWTRLVPEGFYNVEKDLDKVAQAIFSGDRVWVLWHDKTKEEMQVAMLRNAPVKTWDFYGLFVPFIP